MSTKPLPFMTNVLGVVHSYQQTRQVQNKMSGEDRKRRIIQVVDATRHALDVTLWGDHCDVSDLLLDQHPVVSLVNVQIREWNGKACSTVGSSEIEWEPHSEAADELKKWYTDHGAEESFQPLNQGPAGSNAANTRPVKETTLRDMHDEMETVSETDDVRMYKVTAYIMKLLYRTQRQENQFICIYPRCSRCGRKVASESGTPCCENAETQTGLNLACLLADASCSGLRATMFHDQAQSLLGVSAVKVAEWIEESKTTLHPEMNELFEDIVVWRVSQGV
eukprot:Blabericola_migrator_1__5360@NODE_2748_length_2395_cov_129_365550_g1539_i1_p2_GENE_NODE_2748_length_2395_cov_129_365550_g1539_i1NODE_2748_length_2395_cov_129_365550_g1539_i1_p2_ORF_typecomplete_len279_score50_78REPA_OB_2/PF16900_5/3e19REPA_OB_2/PF16900_5/32Rep_facA_C/PF08646_10/7_1e03Rep_facA_C/PF08646_10/2_9e03Rep_facA_C/PF08646_10/3_7e08DUF3127/PF11325_8/0_01DUF3127/PF11325_8/9e02POT1PC/PF16686_5/0_0072CDC24_OB3/PF17244_2/0_01POT1/PF02765_17/0_17POT1/PF02765_17/1_8e03POT1/PF02765_17/3_8e03_NOD